MNTKEKLKLMKEIEQRNEQRRKEFKRQNKRQVTSDKKQATEQQNN